MKLYAAVVRVSHMGERKEGDESFHADEDQVGAINAWAKAKEVRVDVLPSELAGSGGLTIEERPSLRAAVEGVESGKYDGIVVAYLSRLGRNLAEQLRAWDRVERAGGEIVAIRENIDTSTAAGRLHRNLLASIDAHEREQHVEGFERLRKGATEAGVWQLPQTPRGYRKGTDRHLAPDRQAGQVRRASRDYLAGVPIRELSRRLKMTPEGVKKMLRNRVYLGELKVGKHVNPEAHPPLIDLETFEAVQRKLSDGVRPPRGKGGTSLLGGLPRCASCGYVMTRHGSNTGSAYRCRATHSGGRCPRPASIMVKRLEDFVEPIALAELARLRVEASENDRVGEVQAKLASAERELLTYAEATSAADIGAEAYGAGARKRSAAVDEAKDDLAAEKARHPETPKGGTGADVWADLNAHEKNTLLRSLIGGIVVWPVGMGLNVPVGERVRVFAYGAITFPARAGNAGNGIRPISFDGDPVGVLGITAGEDGLEASRRAA